MTVLRRSERQSSVPAIQSGRTISFLHATLNCCSLFAPPNILWLRSCFVKLECRAILRENQVTSQILTKHRKTVEFLALLLLAALIIWLFGRRLDWQQVKLAVQRSDWRLIVIAIIIILLAYLWRVVRWQAFLKPLTPASLREVWIATCVGFAAVLTIGRAGEVVRLGRRERGRCGTVVLPGDGALAARREE